MLTARGIAPSIWGGVLLGSVNLLLRWWRLSIPPTLTFDEIYYVPFAVDILHQHPFFDAHPPLGKYWIALSIACYQALQGRPAIAPTLLSPLSYRWLNAWIGAAIPLLAGWVAWEWSRGQPLLQRRWFAVLAAGCVSLDGMLLVDSRLALLQVALISLGLTGVAAWGRSQAVTNAGPWRLLAGLSLGASMAVKWNGAGYWLVLLWQVGDRAWRHRHASAQPQRPWLWLGLVPLASYCLAWVPYLALTGYRLVPLHQHLWQFHQTLLTPHPYQSAWYTWPLMVRPVAYFYQGWVGQEPLGIGPPTPTPTTVIALYGLNHPWLAWLSTAAMGGIAGAVLSRMGRRLRPGGQPAMSEHGSAPQWVLVLYLSHWLPWALIQRPTFYYHYLPAAIAAELGLAWWLTRWLTSQRAGQCWGVGGLLGLLLAGFLFWLPLWIGWPLSPPALQQRWWFSSWQ